MGAKTRFAGRHCGTAAMLAGMARSYISQLTPSVYQLRS